MLGKPIRRPLRVPSKIERVRRISGAFGRFLLLENLPMARSAKFGKLGSSAGHSGSQI